MPELNYPQAPQPNAGLLTGNPLQTIGALGELQNIGIRAQQAPALAQIPAANLTNTNIANQTAQMQQQDAARKMVWGAIANGVNGIDSPTPDDVNNTLVNLSRVYPQIATQYPEIFNSASDFLLAPGGIKKNSAVMMNSVMSPAEASNPTGVGYDKNTGQPLTGTQATFNVKAAQNGGVATQPPPGTAESVGQMQADLKSEGTYKADISPLEKALDLEKQLGPGVTAPGSAERNKWEAYVYGLMPQLVPKDMQTKIGNYQELEKYLQRQASTQAATMSPHTNEGLAAAATGNPSTSVTDMAGIPLIKWMIAQRRMQHGVVMQAAQSGGANYSTTKAALSATQDPVAYGVDQMDADDRAKYINSLSPAQRANFNKSLKAAYDSQVINRPGQ